MTAAATPRRVEADPGFKNAVDVLAGLMAFARVLRTCGWEVNVAIETGGADRINFSAQLPPSQTGGADA